MQLSENINYSVIFSSRRVFLGEMAWQKMSNYSTTETSHHNGNKHHSRVVQNVRDPSGNQNQQIQQANHVPASIKLTAENRRVFACTNLVSACIQLYRQEERVKDHVAGLDGDW